MAAATAAMLSGPCQLRLSSVRATSRFAPLLPAVSRRGLRSSPIAQVQRAENDLQVHTLRSLVQPLPTLRCKHNRE